MIQIRPAAPTDVNYIRSTWIDAFADWDGTGKARSALPHQLKPSRYRETWRDVIADVLTHSQGLVAFDPEHPDLCIGWLVFERPERHLPIVHFTYTRFRARRRGVLKQLLTHAGLYDAPFAYSHRTQDALRLTKGWEQSWVVAPEYDFTLCFRRPHVVESKAA